MEGGDILEKERISVIGAAAVCDYIYEVSKLPGPGDIVEITKEYPDPVWGDVPRILLLVLKVSQGLSPTFSIRWAMTIKTAA